MRVLGWLTLLLGILGAGRPVPPGVIEIKVSQDGFRPKVVNLRKGETVKLALRAVDREHCFAIDELRIEKRLLPGKTVNVDLTAERAGIFSFYCCLEPQSETMKGRLVVAE